MKTNFITDYDVDKLIPADYNPRKLDPDKFDKLKYSITKFGIIKPLIVNGDNNILTAGHQRTRAIKAVGIKKVPVIRIQGIKIEDEIKFNLFHNSIETNKSKVKITRKDLKVGYTIIEPNEIEFEKNENASVVKEIGKLILRYGEWGSIVCDTNGDVILNNDYAVCSKQLNKQVICYVVDKADVPEIKQLLNIEYGEYNYDTLGIKSYNQLYCQMNRLTKNSKKLNKSTCYERYVIPNINKEMRILDFGAGKCAYVDLLKKNNYKIFGYEPNFQNKNRNIDLNVVVKQLQDIENDVKQNGLYDVVVLDSVLNSVVSNDVENMVIATCWSFLKKDGMFITATRNLGQVEAISTLEKCNTAKRTLEFLDKNNFSATFRDGVWTMQHFHTQETLNKLLSKYYKDVTTYGNGTSSQVYAIAKNKKAQDGEYIEKSLEFELNMEYPNNYRHNKHLGLKKEIMRLNYEN